MKFNTVIRGVDGYGSGAFMASRGSRKHKGIDPVFDHGEEIIAVEAGKVTKLGYPYKPSDKKKGHMRYVEVMVGDKRYRYFYVSPGVKKGQVIEEGQVIGKAQNIAGVYPGITPHIHFEILLPNGKPVDPTDYVSKQDG